jgi:hypothetical protein
MTLHMPVLDHEERQVLDVITTLHGQGPAVVTPHYRGALVQLVTKDGPKTIASRADIRDAGDIVRALNSG